MAELRFEDPETLEDLRTYVARARTLDPGGAIRLQAHGMALAAVQLGEGRWLSVIAIMPQDKIVAVAMEDAKRIATEDAARRAAEEVAKRGQVSPLDAALAAPAPASGLSPLAALAAAPAPEPVDPSATATATPGLSPLAASAAAPAPEAGTAPTPTPEPEKPAEQTAPEANG